MKKTVLFGIIASAVLAPTAISLKTNNTPIIKPITADAAKVEVHAEKQAYRIFVVKNTFYAIKYDMKDNKRVIAAKLYKKGDLGGTDKNGLDKDGFDIKPHIDKIRIIKNILG